MSLFFYKTEKRKIYTIKRQTEKYLHQKNMKKLKLNRSSAVKEMKTSYRL